MPLLQEQMGLSCIQVFPESQTEERQDEEKEKGVPNGKYSLLIIDAIRETLQNQWALYNSEYNIDAQLGLYQQAVGAFDTQFNASITNLEQYDLQAPLGLVKSDITGRVTTTNLSLSKLQRNGATLSLSYENINTYDPFTIPCSPPRTDFTIVTFSLQQPLLRNFLYSPATILEQTQNIAFQAARLMNIQNLANALPPLLSLIGIVSVQNKFMKRS